LNIYTDQHFESKAFLKKGDRDEYFYIFVTCEPDFEIDGRLRGLFAGGDLKMNLEQYPSSEKGALINEQLGVSRQLYLP